MRFLVFFLFIPQLGLCLGFFWNFSIFFILHTFGRFLQRAALKKSFDNKSDTAYSLFCDCGVCVFSCHCGLNFEEAIGKTNNRRNNELFQWHLICLACISLQGARSPAITLHNQFPYTDGRNVVVWFIWTGRAKKKKITIVKYYTCLLYTSPSPRDA